MKRFFQAGLGVVGIFLAVACGPTVSVTKYGGVQAARGSDCSLQFIDTEEHSKLLDAHGKLVAVGQVTIRDPEMSDPFSAEYRALVRDHACKLGGRWVGLARELNHRTPARPGTVYKVLAPVPETGADSSTRP